MLDCAKIQEIVGTTFKAIRLGDACMVGSTLSLTAEQQTKALKAAKSKLTKAGYDARLTGKGCFQSLRVYSK